MKSSAVLSKLLTIQHLSQNGESIVLYLLELAFLHLHPKSDHEETNKRSWKDPGGIFVGFRQFIVKLCLLCMRMIC